MFQRETPLSKVLQTFAFSHESGDSCGVVGTSLQQNGFNKQICKDKICETMDNTYENLSIEMPKAQTV